MLAWQCAKQILQLYCDMDASKPNSIGLLIEAFATFLLENAEFLIFASIASLLLVLRQHLGSDFEKDILAPMGTLRPEVVEGGRRVWAWVKDKHIDHTNPSINAWFFFVELFVIYQGVHLVSDAQVHVTSSYPDGPTHAGCLPGLARILSGTNHRDHRCSGCPVLKESDSVGLLACEYTV